MKYMIGDKVKMKKGGCDFGHPTFLSKHNYVLTIKECFDCYYLMEEDNECWYLEAQIEGLYVKETFEPVENRWQILDL